ncbi:MAG: glycosyltransferase family 4 protein [Sphingomonas sp.]
MDAARFQETPGMRITHVVRQYPPGIGGMENFVRSLAERQAAGGHGVRVVTLNRIFGGPGGTLPPVDWRGGVEIRRVPFLGGIRYPLAPGILGQLGKPDIVHVHGLEFAADWLAHTQWLHRTPMVISTHGGFFHTSFARTLKRVWFHTITRATLRRYHAVLASSVQDAETFSRIAPDRVHVVENAVDTDRFAGLANHSGKTMIYFGRLAPNKGLPRLLRWFAQLLKRDADWRLIIAGKEMGVTLAALRQLALELGIESTVELHASPGDAALSALIGRARVYACASTYEGFGLAAVEGAAAGLYPLLSDIPAFRRTLDRIGFGTASTFEGDDGVDRFLADLSFYQPDRARREQLNERLETFGWPRVLQEIEAHYRSALAPASTDRAEPGHFVEEGHRGNAAQPG